MTAPLRVLLGRSDFRYGCSGHVPASDEVSIIYMIVPGPEGLLHRMADPFDPAWRNEQPHAIGIRTVTVEPIR